MRHIFARTKLLSVFALLFTVLPLQAQIQQGGQSPGQGQQAPQAVQLSPEQIQAAGQAFVQIQTLRQEYRNEHGSLSNMDSTRAQKIQSQFRQETHEAIKEAGISRQKFSIVMQMAPSNESIKKQFFAAIKEAGGQPPRMPDRSQRGRQRGQQPAPNVDVSDAQLGKIASAFVSIQELRQQFQQDHGAVQDSTKRRQLQQQFRAEAQQAIQDEAVSQQLFSKVLRAARSDSSLRERFFAAVEEAGGQVPGGAGQ